VLYKGSILLSKIHRLSNELLSINIKLKQCQVMKGSLFRQNSSALILSRILTLHNYNISETDQYDKDKFEIFNNFVILEDSSIINRIKYRAEEFLKIE